MTNKGGKRLARELSAYKANLPSWSAKQGEFVLIKEEEVAGFFSSYDDALKSGYEKFGLQPFLVKQINVIEQAQFISRSVDPCLTSLSK